MYLGTRGKMFTSCGMALREKLLKRRSFFLCRHWAESVLTRINLGDRILFTMDELVLGASIKISSPFSKEGCSSFIIKYLFGFKLNVRLSVF